VDIATWLHGLGLSEYEQAFRENAIEFEILPELTADDLKEIGVIPVGHRRKLLAAIAALRPSASPAPDDARDARVQSSPADPIGERRQVTVLFADLAGYTAWGQQLDAEEVHALLEQFFDRADRIIQEHGGRIDKHIGDCVMGVFGAPIAHSDDPERAARAALAINAAIPDVSAPVGRPIGIHIGVAGGQVVASRTGSTSHSEYTVTGDTVNLASRLTAAAEKGEILASDDTYRALAERFDCVDAGALNIKGFTEPVRAWRLFGVRPAAREQRPFVGRHSELRLSAAALAACRETGRGQTIFIRGEAGSARHD
jgi:class 3 adenylate cyclase